MYLRHVRFEIICLHDSFFLPFWNSNRPGVHALPANLIYTVSSSHIKCHQPAVPASSHIPTRFPRNCLIGFNKRCQRTERPPPPSASERNAFPFEVLVHITSNVTQGNAALQLIKLAYGGVRSIPTWFYFSSKNFTGRNFKRSTSFAGCNSLFSSLASWNSG